MFEVTPSAASLLEFRVRDFEPTALTAGESRLNRRQCVRLTRKLNRDEAHAADQ